MDIYCQECQEIVGRLADEKIPPNRKGHVTCPRCRAKIHVYRSQEETDRSGKGESTDKEGGLEARSYKAEFTGSGSEYFRIWIVNIFLTVITLGIYAAWAKVRTRRYFYAHTKLAGHPFDYLANPVAILKGNLIVGGGLILYNSSQFFSPLLTLAIIALFAISIPFLIWKSLRFYAHNSAFRNIRFRFRGSMKGSYMTYFLLPMCIPLTLGLIIPYWTYHRKRYFFSNLAFGTTSNIFSGEVKRFYATYLKAFLMIIAAAVIMALTVSLGAFSILPLLKSAASHGQEGFKLGVFFVIFGFLAYISMILIFTGIQQYIYARLTNYCWGVSRLGKVSFLSTIRARKLIWIRLTNILAIILSIGLFTPWAKVRRIRYILENLEVRTRGDLSEFAAATDDDESAYGDAATDFFDIEIGL